MRFRRSMLVAPKLLGALLTTSLALWAAYLLADSNGKTGVSTSSSGCSCHGSTPNGNGAVTVSITGPQTVTAGSIADYTISVSGGPAGTTGGFDLSSDGGTFTAGANNRVSGSELTHSNNSTRSWSFRWTAPATAGTYRFRAVALATNGSGTSNDSWNWYGGAAATPFSIAVGPAGDTVPPAAVRDLQ